MADVNWTAYENDPEFKALDYAQQVRIRSMFAQKYLGSDPEFQALSKPAQAEFYNRYISKPSFTADPNSPEGRHLARLTAAAGRVKDDDDLGNRLKAFFLDIGLKFQGGPTTAGSVKAMELLEKAGIEPRIEARTLERIQRTGTEIVNIRDLNLEDMRKVRDYNTHIASQVPGVALANTLRGFASTMIQAGVLNKILVGSAASVYRAAQMGDGVVRGGLLTQKAFEGIARVYAAGTNHGKVATFLGAKLLPTVIEESAEGLVWATKSIIGDLMTGEVPTTREALQMYAQDFGFGMGIQALLGAGSKLRHALKGSDRRILGVTDELAELKHNISVDEGKYLMLEGITPGSMPDAVKRELIAKGHKDLIDLMHNYAKKVQIDHTIDTSDPEKLLTQIMKTGGIDLKRVGTMFELESFGDVPFKKKVHTFQDALVEYEKYMNIVTGKVSASDFVVKSLETGTLRAGKDVKLKLKKADDLLDAKTFADDLNPQSGRLDPTNVLQSVKRILRKQNVPDEILDKLNVKTYDDYFTGKRYDLPNGDLLSVPTVFKSMAEQEQYLSGVKRYLHHIIKKADIDLPPKALDDAFDSLKKPRGSRLLTDDTWIARRVNSINGQLKRLETGEYEIKHADGTVETFPNKEALGNSLYNGAIDSKDVKNFLENEMGYALRQNAAGEFIVNTDSKVIGPYKEVSELLDANPHFRPPYPIETAPTINLIDETLDKVKIINDKVIAGPLDLIEEHLRNHSDWRKARKSITKKHLPGLGNKRISVEAGTNTYWLEDPTTGFRKQFRSLYGKNGMATFVSNAKNRFEDLQIQAALGGYKVMADRGGYYMVGAHKTFFARTMDQLEDLVSKEARQLDAPEMTAEVYPEDEMLNIKRVLDTDLDVPPTGPKTMTEAAVDSMSYGFWERTKDFTAHFRAPFGILEGAIDKFPAVKAFLKEAQNVKLAHFNHQRHMNNIRDQLTARIKKAKLSSYQRQTMTNILMQEIPREDWIKEAKRLNVPLNEKMIEEMNFLRDTFDQLQDVFKIPQSMRVENYFSRLKRLFESEIQRPGFMREASEIINEGINKRIIPSNVKEYFKNVRTSEVVSFVLEKDPYAVLMKYIDIGFKKQNVEPIWDSLNGLLKKYKATQGAQGMIPERVLTTTQHILDQAIGHNPSQLYRTLKRATLTGTVELSHSLKKVEDRILKMFPERAFDEKVSMKTRMRDRLTGFSDIVVGDDPFAPLGRAIIGATQAFKPWLVLRNVHQPLMTVAPFFGFDYTLAGYATAIKPKNFRQIYKYMLDNGFLNTVAPTEIPVVRSKRSLLQNINDKGLWAYHWSDTFNRMVTFATVDHKFTDILTTLKKHPELGKKWFVKHSGLFAVDPVTQDAVYDALKKGDVISARDIFARQVISNSQFDYISLANPKAFTGLSGKMFGTFGTYPVQYTENIYRALRSGDAEDKALFVTRLLGASAALTAFYSGAFGADVQSFNPASTMFFTGSPIYQQAVDTLELTGGLGNIAQTGELGFRARQALGRTQMRLPQAFLPYVGRGFDLITIDIDDKHGDGWFPVAGRKILGTPGRNQ